MLSTTTLRFLSIAEKLLVLQIESEEADMNRPTLITLLQDNRSRFEQALSHVNPAYLTEPPPFDRRSVKDLLVHLTTWEQRLIRWLQEAARGETPAIPEPGLTWADMDRLNEETLRQNCHRPFTEILSLWQRSFQKLLAQINEFSDADLFEIGRFAWMADEHGDYPLWDMIVAGPGCCHYHDHFYDLLTRTDPEKRFVPDLVSLNAFAGIYIDSRQRTLIFHVVENSLHLNVTWRGRKLSSLALDERRFVYEDFGLVTFQPALGGTVSVVEWWNQTFRRTKEEGESVHPL